MVNLLAAAAIVWPLFLGTVVWHRAAAGPAVWTTVVHAAASRICHQRPERSFSTAGVQWPVCGRCSGVYVGAALGALAALALRRRAALRRGRAVPLLAAAAAPNGALFAAEWANLLDVTNQMRFAAGLLLGAAVLVAIYAEVRRPALTDQPASLRRP
jgi:uncharacterized membrane protein